MSEDVNARPDLVVYVSTPGHYEYWEETPAGTSAAAIGEYVETSRYSGAPFAAAVISSGGDRQRLIDELRSLAGWLELQPEPAPVKHLQLLRTDA